MIKLITIKKAINCYDFNFCLYYGIGSFQKKKITSLLGLGSSGFISEIEKPFIGKIEMFLREHFVLDDYLKIRELENIKFLQAIKSYRGLRHKWKLPVNGQRTRSNAKTFRKMSQIKLQRYIHDVYRLK